MSRCQDTLDTADRYARARLYQAALGWAVCALGLGALYLGNVPVAMALVAIGGKLMPTGTFMGPKQ